MAKNRDYQAKCPNLIKAPHLQQKTDAVVCGYGGYEILVTGIFTKESGFDPLGCLVKCRRCGNEYYLFPQISLKL